jgi:phage shock protein E
MRPATTLCSALVVGLCLSTGTAASVDGDSASIPNPAIDMQGYVRLTREAAELRKTHRLSEDAFLRASQEPNTLVLDARSRDKFAELHLKGAVNLPFSDITVASLAQLIPDRTTRILIYCNNNFAHAEGPFPSKLATASLNLSTYVALYTYGYRNVFELGPLIDIRQAKLEFESTVPGGSIASSRP